jgi:hypothetical protein
MVEQTAEQEPEQAKEPAKEPAPLSRVPTVMKEAAEHYARLAKEAAGLVCRTDADYDEFALFIAGRWKAMSREHRDALGVMLAAERMAGVVDEPVVTMHLPTLYRRIAAR